ncbi:MAG: DNA polymerase IV [Candidatus Berkelbacteria bacterium]
MLVIMSITTEPKDYSVLFLDMNSFFASVEQQVQPTLRGRPIGVAPYIGRTGCIIAASYEAKQMGVKICQVGEAKKICPQIAIIEAQPSLYMIYHKKIKKVIESFTPYFEAKSVDEFAIHLTPMDQNREKATELALKMKKAIAEEVGDYLKCSIGIAPSVFLAKMASELKKPDGLTVLELKDLDNFYHSLKLQDLTGINWRTEASLQRFKINSPADFYGKSLEELVRLLKHMGRLWYFRLRGYEVDDHVVKSKTIGHSHVLAPEFRTKDGATAILRKLIFKAGYRLRKEGYCAGGISLMINFLDGQSFSVSRRFSVFSDNQSFLQNTYELLKDCPWRGRPILVAVSSFDLQRKTSEQISIFADLEKSKSLSLVLDKINDEFGAETVFPASMHTAKDSAPDRIPFGKPRYDILH